MGWQRTAWLREPRAPHPAWVRTGTGYTTAATPWDIPSGAKHTFNPLFAPILPNVNLTEFVPHSFSLLETQPKSSLP